jgi:C4-dicarboxylate-specific signal transduction histidine kinase
MVASSSTGPWSSTAKKGPSLSRERGRTERTTDATSNRKIGPWCAAWSATPASKQDALTTLNAVYSLAEDYVNFLQPVLKLVEKTRNGPRVRRRYDTAQTPYRRLLALGNLAAATSHHLDARYAAVRPIHLKTALEEAQTELAAHATRSHSAVMQRMALGQVPL